MVRLILTVPLTDGGDMDARDYIKMRYEKRLRDGIEDGSGHNQSIGSFERFTKVSIGSCSSYLSVLLCGSIASISLM